MDLRDIGLGVWSAFCRSIETGGGLLWIRWWTFCFWCHGVSYFRKNKTVWQFKVIQFILRNYAVCYNVEFAPRSVHVGFLVDTEARRQVFVRLRFSSVKSFLRVSS
jgi:hypothetical protein